MLIAADLEMFESSLGLTLGTNPVKKASGEALEIDAQLISTGSPQHAPSPQAMPARYTRSPGSC